MNGSNLAVDTSSYPNHIEDFARRHGLRCLQNTACKNSKYITTPTDSSEFPWRISITHSDSLCEDIYGQSDVSDYGDHRDGSLGATDTVIPEKEIADLQRFIQARQVEEETESWDIETRLIPPPMPTRRIRVKFRFIGKEAPRIFFDPDRD